MIAVETQKELAGRKVLEQQNLILYNPGVSQWLPPPYLPLTPSFQCERCQLGNHVCAVSPSRIEKGLGVRCESCIRLKQGCSLYTESPTKKKTDDPSAPKKKKRAKPSALVIEDSDLEILAAPKTIKVPRAAKPAASSSSRTTLVSPNPVSSFFFLLTFSFRPPPHMSRCLQRADLLLRRRLPRSHPSLFPQIR